MDLVQESVDLPVCIQYIGGSAIKICTRKLYAIDVYSYV